MASLYSAPWSHSDTPHSVGFLWTSHQPDAGTSPWQHTTLTRDKYPYPSGIRTPVSGSELLQTHALGREANLFPYSGENLVTSRWPASFPDRLWPMLLDNNGQSLDCCNVCDPYWGAGSVGGENVEFSISKDFPLQFHTIACLVLWKKRRIFRVTLHRVSFREYEIYDWYSAVI